MKRPAHLLILFGLSLLMLAGCRDEDETSSWTPTVLAPLFKTSLTVDQIVPDSVTNVDGDDFVEIVYTYPLEEIGVASQYFTVPDTFIDYIANLEQLKLDNNDLIYQYELGEVDPTLNALNGLTLPVPAQVVTTAQPFDIDANEFFEEATFKEGTILISVENNFPVGIVKATLELRNKSDNSVVVSKDFDNIPTGTTKLDSADLAGKTMEGDLIGQIVYIETASSSGPVRINVKDYVEIIVSIRRVKVERAIAIFPAQDLFNRDEDIEYNFGEPRIVEMTLETGTLAIEVQSNVDETINTIYSAPGITKDGAAVYERFDVPPPDNDGETRIKDVDVDLNGYTLDMTGKIGLPNHTHQILIASIDQTTTKKEISLDDEIRLRYRLFGVTPNYALGYLGTQSYSVGPETSDFDAFSQIKGSLEFENVNFKIRIENGFGINASLDLKDLTAINTKTNQEVSLSSSLIDQPISLDRATRGNGPIPSIKDLEFNTDNSNIRDFLALSPDKIRYAVDAEVNPNDDQDLLQFLYDSSKVKTSVEMGLPLAVKASGLIIEDTLSFDLIGLDEERNVRNALLRVITYNTYPFDANIQLYFLDSNQVMIDSLFQAGENSSATAGSLNITSQKVEQASKSVLHTNVSESKLERIKQATRVRVKARFDTPPSAGFVRLYSTYKLDLVLTAELKYEIDN